MTEKNDLLGKISSCNFEKGKLFLLGLFSLVLSHLLPLAFFASLPLCYAFLIYGRSQTFKMLFSFLLSMIILISMVDDNQHLIVTTVIYLWAIGHSTLITKVIFDKKSPIQGVVSSAGVLTVVLFFCLGIIVFSSDLSMEEMLDQKIAVKIEEIVENVKEEQKELNISQERENLLEEFTADPKKMVKQIIHNFFSWIFISLFFGTWVTFMLLLKNSTLWRKFTSYPFTLDTLKSFKVHESFIYPVIISLIVILLPVDFIGELSQVIGKNFLYCISIFYFFQGFGIFTLMLDIYKIQGFLRNCIIVISLIIAGKFIAIIGLFNLWIDFKSLLYRILKNRGGEG